MKTIYPEYYTDEDKAIYDDLYSRGTQLLGKKLNYNDEFLLDLSAKITINQMKGNDNGLSKEEVEEIKKLHQENMSGTFETPPELFYDGLMRTSDGKSVIPHPLSVSEEEMFDKYRKPPKDVVVPEALETDENSDKVSIEFLTKKVDEMLEVN
jgi:hypothetical protein